MRDEMVTFPKGICRRINIKVRPQRRSLKSILLLFVEPYAEGARDSEKYFNPNLTKVSITVNGSPNMLYNNSIEGKDIWAETSRFFVKTKNAAHESGKVLHLWQVWAFDRLAHHSRSGAARQRHAPREHTRWSSAWTRAKRERLEPCELPCLRHQWLADEHIGAAIRICAILI